MITDALCNFVPIGGNLSLVGGAGVAIPSPGIYDFLGLGVGVAPNERIWGTPTTFGQADAMGVGNQRPELNISVGTGLVSAAGARLNVALQGAADQGAAGNYQPGTWNTFAESGPITAANAPANTVIFRCPWLPPFPANLRPRYLRLLFTPLATDAAPATPLAFTAGTIASAIVVMSRDDLFNKYSAKNFTVA